MPFAVDGSRMRLNEEKIQRTFSLCRRAFASSWRLPKTISEPSDVFSDLRSSPVAVQFPTPIGEVKTMKDGNQYILNYQSKDGDEKIILTDQEIRHVGRQTPRWNVSENNIPKDTGASLKFVTKNDETTLTPVLTQTTSWRWRCQRKYLAY